MRLVTTFLLSAICLTAPGQPFSTTRIGFIDTESEYLDATGKGITVQNSLPKGGGRYTDATGKQFFYVVFWTRILNATDAPLEIEMNMPADSFAISSSTNSYVKLFLPPDTMTIDKVLLYDYGLNGLEAFLDSALNESSTLQRTIGPKEESLFYTVALLHQAAGPVRARLVVEADRLYYKINLLLPALIPCGQIVFRK